MKCRYDVKAQKIYIICNVCSVCETCHRLILCILTEAFNRLCPGGLGYEKGDTDDMSGEMSICLTPTARGSTLVFRI